MTDRNTSNSVADRELERQADRATVAAVAGRSGIGSSLQATGQEMHIQRDVIGEVAVGAALFTVEAGSEVAIEEEAIVPVTEAAPLASEATTAATVGVGVAATALSLRSAQHRGRRVMFSRSEPEQP